MGDFYISGQHIVGPDGELFYPVGANVNGPESWDNDNENLRTLGHSTDAQRWGFNTLRLTTCTGQGNRNGADYPDDDLDAIIAEYTAKKIVIMLEGRYDCTKAGTPPTDAEYESVRKEFTEAATKHKNNPYVWFNLFNEPTQHSNDPNHEAWRTIHTNLARAVRETGNTSIIVVDGSNWGQENHWANGYELVNTEDSAILKYGDDVMRAAGNCNVLYSFHVYSEWKAGVSAMRDYINKVHASGKALVIGETGMATDDSVAESLGTDATTNHANVRTVYEVAPSLGVGVVIWHGAGRDGFNLVQEDTDNPLAYWAADQDFTNLTEFGKLHHELASNPPQLSSTKPLVAPNCIASQ